MKRLSVELPEETHNEIKAACAKEGVSITEKVTELLLKWLKEKK